MAWLRPSEGMKVGAVNVEDETTETSVWCLDRQPNVALVAEFGAMSGLVALNGEEHVLLHIYLASEEGGGVCRQCFVGVIPTRSPRRKLVSKRASRALKCILLLILKLSEPHRRVLTPPKLTLDLELFAIQRWNTLAQLEGGVAEAMLYTKTHRLLVPDENGARNCVRVSSDHPLLHQIVDSDQISRCGQSCA